MPLVKPTWHNITLHTQNASKCVQILTSYIRVPFTNVDDDKIYIFGGIDENGQRNNDIFQYFI